MPEPTPVLPHLACALMRHNSVERKRCLTEPARSGTSWVLSSAATAGGAATFADVAASGGAHLGAAGEAQRCVGRPSLLSLHQLGRALRGGSSCASCWTPGLGVAEVLGTGRARRRACAHRADRIPGMAALARGGLGHLGRVHVLGGDRT